MFFWTILPLRTLSSPHTTGLRITPSSPHHSLLSSRRRLRPLTLVPAHAGEERQGQSPERREKAEGQSPERRGKGTSNASEGMNEEFTPVDVNVNLVKSFLDSFASQQGLPGPASNLLGLMGLHIPQDTNKDTNKDK